MPSTETNSHDFTETHVDGLNALHNENTHDSRHNDYTKPESEQMEGLSRQPTASFIPMGVFEKTYLTLRSRVRGHLRSTFGNPIPLFVLPHPQNLRRKLADEPGSALMGFLIASTPLGMNLMGTYISEEKLSCLGLSRERLL